MLAEAAHDILEHNADGQPNETMPFQMIRNKTFSLRYYDCPDPPSDSKPFESRDEFVKLLEGKRELMYICLRNFYFPNKELTSVSKGVSGYMINGKTYMDQATLDDVSQDFHHRFKFTDFHVYKSWENNYGFKLCPTRNLKRLDEEGHKQWEKEVEKITSFMKKKTAEKNFYHNNNSFEKLWSNQNVQSCAELIKSKWQKAWNLMADGETSTNAYLATRSIYKLFGELKNRDLIQKGVKFVDLGSSYGSFLWYAADYLKDFKPILVGYEYSLLRHLWGSKCTKELLEAVTKLDNCPLQSYQVHLIHQDLLHTNELGSGINIAFQFDKAFVIGLCLHTMFCVLNTESVCIFITCKSNNPSTGYYQDIVQQTGYFKKICTVKGCQMNDGESSGDFYIYKKTGTKQVTTDYIKNFLAATAIDHAIVEEVVATWREAKPLGDDLPFNKMYSGNNMKERYQDAAKDAWDLLDEQSHIQRKCRSKSKRTEKCVSAEDNARCRDNACVTCSAKYPKEKDAAKFLQKRFIDNAKGNGIFATKIIEAQQFLLEYKGRIVPSTTTGEYVAKKGSYRIDAKNSKGLAKYINHSCAPNAAFERVYVELDTGSGKKKRTGRHSEDLQLWIVSIKKISKGEEITCDYGFDFKINECLCCKCMSKQI